MVAREGMAEASAERAGRDYVAQPAELPRGTLVDVFFHAVGHDKTEAQYRATESGWQPISHAELYAEVRRLVSALRDLGIERGDRCAIISENRPEWPLADYALLCAGALCVPIYPTLGAAQLGYILEHSGTRLIFVSTAEQLAKVREARAHAPGRPAGAGRASGARGCGVPGGSGAVAAG